MKVKLVTAVLAITLGAIALPAAAQVKPEVMVKQRQSAMTLVGKYWGPLGAMAQGKAPFNAAMVSRNAAFLEALIQMPWDGFDASTQDVKSAALPAIWADAAKFKGAQENAQKAIAALAAAAKGGNEAAIKAAMGDVGKACGGCHNDFRQKQ